jgi:hypothetical protein
VGLTIRGKGENDKEGDNSFEGSGMAEAGSQPRRPA